MAERITSGPFAGFGRSVVYRAAASTPIAAALIYLSVSYAVARKPLEAVLLASLALIPTLEVFAFVIAAAMLLSLPKQERASALHRTPSAEEIAARRSLYPRGYWRLALFAAFILAEIWVLARYGHRAEPALIWLFAILAFVPLFLRREKR